MVFIFTSITCSYSISDSWNQNEIKETLNELFQHFFLQSGHVSKIIKYAKNRSAKFNDHLPELRICEGRNNARRFVPVLLRM